MKALRYENQKLSVAEVPPPRAEGEAVVRVTLSGICNTDLEIARGYAGFQGTLGHEFVGVIEDVSEARASAIPTGRDSLTVGPLTPGTRVVGEINAGCGLCDLCQAGDSRHCLERSVLGIVGRDGTHAEFLRLPLRNLLPVPDEIPDERAVFTEPLAAACGILERVEVTENSSIAVIGDGKLGLLCAQVLKTTGAPVMLIGKHASKLAIAQRRGIETIQLAEVREYSPKFDVVVEASGSPEGFRLGLDLLRPRGSLVLKSTFHGVTEIAAAPLVVNEISVIGSRCGRFAPALELLKTGAVNVDSLISEEFPLSDGVLAMERAAQAGVVKVLLRP
ncbi:MAG: alcohol dehydrogenase catalytic domain-containing protein [Acidobacteriota bacterium]